jgi:hypothetical protein
MSDPPRWFSGAYRSQRRVGTGSSGRFVLPCVGRFWPKAAVTGIHLGQQLSGDKPPSMLMITRSKAAALREAEQDKLATAEHENCLGLMQHDEVRPRHLGDTIKSLQSPIGRLNV